MKRKILTVVTLCLILSVLLCGCSIVEVDPSAYPLMPPVDTSGMVLTQVNGEQAQTSYDAQNWSVEEDASLLTLVLSETAEEQHITNITLQVSSEYEGPFTAKERNSLYQSFSSYGFSSLDTFELRRIGEDVIVYIEAVTEFTDGYLDTLLEEGLLTEEAIDAMGGREAILQYPTTYQTVIYAIRDGHICVYTGTSYSKERISEVLDQMMVMVENTKVMIATES